MQLSKVGYLVGFSTSVAASLYGESNLNHTCLLDTPYLSCSAQANPATVDTCCVETYGGLVVSTQFWDTYTGLESQGQLLPPNSWGLHGLWPDFCNGSYTQYCDLSRQYDPQPSPKTTNGLANGTISNQFIISFNDETLETASLTTDLWTGTVIPPYTGPPVTTFLTAAGRYDLLDYMNHYWVNQGEPDWYFWAHEFSKHATCYSTFDLPCYGTQYINHSDVIQFWETAIQYYQLVPTYQWLADAEITPSNTTTYTLSDLQNVLAEEFGAVPYLGCTGPKYNTTSAGEGSDDNGYTILDEVWYFHHVYGQPQRIEAVAVNSTSESSCATTKGAIKYPLRTNGSEWTVGSYTPSSL